MGVQGAKSRLRLDQLACFAQSCQQVSWRQLEDGSRGQQSKRFASLMEERGLRQRDLIPIFGASSVGSDVLKEKRSISKAHARKLAEFFNVPVSLFI